MMMQYTRLTVLFGIATSFSPALFAQADPGGSPPETAAPARAEVKKTDIEGIEILRVRSDLLTGFSGHEVFIEAGIVVPPQGPDADMPVCFNIHGFGGSHKGALTQGAQIRGWMKAGSYPRMLYVYPNANGPSGHTGFADSDNNGPWARAFVEELLPAVESLYPVGGRPESRFLTGHSSGGWAALWLQVAYPRVFGGAWATAPDSVDFRDLCGVNIYSFKSAFTDLEGAEIPVARHRGKYVMTARQMAPREDSIAQLRAFNAAFGPRGEDDQPVPLFDRKSGIIDRAVTESWARYDLRKVIEDGSVALRSQLTGKLHVFVGEWDNARLDGPVRLLDDALVRLGVKAAFVYAPKRDHFDLLKPHPELWPRALLTRIHNEMLGMRDR